MSGIVATSLITLIPFLLCEINDGIYLKAFRVIQKSIQTLNNHTCVKELYCLKRICLGIRDIVLMAVLKFPNIFSA